MSLDTATATEEDLGRVTFRDRTLGRVYFRDGRPAWDPKLATPADTWPQYELVCTPIGTSCQFLTAVPDAQRRVVNPIFYQEPSGDIHGIRYCSDTTFPDCGVLDSVNGQPIVRVPFRSRFDVLLQSRDVMFIRVAGSLGGDDLRHSQEYVLRRVLDEVQ